MRDIQQAILALSVSDLYAFLGSLSVAFDEKAEALYQENPNLNGQDAQVYADIAALFREAAVSDLEDDADVVISVDELSSSVEDSSTPSVSRAVEASRPKSWVTR